MNESLNRAKIRLQQAFEDNPLQVIFVGSLALTASAKVLSAVNESRNSRTWKKEVDRRRMKM